MSLQSYYYLRKDTFSIDPWRDAGVYFGEAHLEKRIRDRLEGDFLQARSVPKFFIYGRYGAGKTHTLAHIQHVLKSNESLVRDFPTEPIYFEIAPIRARESWHAIHERLVDAIGRERLRDAMKKLVDGSGTNDPIQALEAREVLRFGEEAVRKSQAQIFRTLLFGGRQATLAWEWLKGKPLKTDEAAVLETETNLAEASALMDCLLNCASLVHRGSEKKIVFLIDEGEAVGNLANPDSQNEFAFSLRRLAGNENNVLGFVISFENSGGMESAPNVFTREDIRRRVDFDQGFIDLTNLLPPEAHAAQEFIYSVLAHVVDQKSAKAAIEREKLETEPEYFPFTLEALERIAEFVTQDPEKSIPSRIIDLLSNAVVRGWRARDPKAEDKHVLIGTEIVDAVMYPDDAAV